MTIPSPQRAVVVREQGCPGTLQAHPDSTWQEDEQPSEDWNDRDDAEHAVLAPDHDGPRRSLQDDDDVVAALPVYQRVGIVD